MTIELSKMVPADQIVILHAHLSGVDHPGTRRHIRETIGHLEYKEVAAGKTFFDMVTRRRMFPAPKYRQCTSDLKRDPINKFIRQDLKARGKTLAVSCIGIRAEESAARAKQDPFKLNKRLSKAGRTVFDLMPIFDYTIHQVFKTISAARQKPHPVYSKGMTRLSCCFCIMASAHDLRTGAILYPELYKKYVDTEISINHTMRHGASLEQITGITITGQATKTERSGARFVQQELFCY
ncbi:MAG: phosphoadenosine phosphosulfate reductase family protein [bacterium]|nr:phosphoadenosine phosphosulfate reductase family protein [bacterium]